MDDNITLKRGDLEQVVRDALRLGAQGHGVKHKRLVQGLMDEADEKADHKAAEALKQLVGMTEYRVELPEGAHIVPPAAGHVISDDKEKMTAAEIDALRCEPDPSQTLPRASGTTWNKDGDDEREPEETICGAEPAHDPDSDERVLECLVKAERNRRWFVLHRCASDALDIRPSPWNSLSGMTRRELRMVIEAAGAKAPI